MPNTISTFLWFESNAADAAKLYCSIFPDSKITSSGPQGTSFELFGQRFVAFNGGPAHKLSAAVSLFVPCETQAEVDALWQRFLAEGGTESRCGWLTDRYGLSWQIIPTRMLALIGDSDPVKAKRAVDCMLTMRKIDLAAIERAHDGK